ncbi:hypothetical protein [Parasphingorhabdus halotolerans]|nr:hypothetical protein [Parasphingorhabdus halotolerans]
MLENLEGAPPLRTTDGGTHYLTYRDDRFTCVSGTELLKSYKVVASSPTSRMVASCCNSAMYLKYSRGHWTSSYAARFGDGAPHVEMRTQTKFRNSTLPLSENSKNFSGFGTRLLWRLFVSRIAMMFN